MSKRQKNQGRKRPWRLVLAAGGIALLIGPLCWVRSGSLSEAQERPGVGRVAGAPQPQPAGPVPPPVSTDYGERAVAFLHDSIPIARNELGESLLARHGAEKLQYLVN